MSLCDGSVAFWREIGARFVRVSSAGSRGGLVCGGLVSINQCWSVPWALVQAPSVGARGAGQAGSGRCLIVLIWKDEPTPNTRCQVDSCTLANAYDVRDKQCKQSLLLPLGYGNIYNAKGNGIERAKGGSASAAAAASSAVGRHSSLVWAVRRLRPLPDIWWPQGRQFHHRSLDRPPTIDNSTNLSEKRGRKPSTERHMQPEPLQTIQKGAKQPSHRTAQPESAAR
jgi:hypothetical protein